MKNLAYIHLRCKESEYQYINCDAENVKSKNVYDLARDIKEFENKGREIRKASKFDNLKVYFHNVRKLEVSLSFSDIEKLIGEKLCDSAYKYKSYFYNNKDSSSISNCWLSQGYKITEINLDEKRIYFKKDTPNKSRVFLEKYLFDRNLPKEAIDKIENCFKDVKNEFGL